MGNYWGSAPPPVAKPPEPPRSPSLRSITGVQHPLQWQSHRSLPAHPRFAQLLGFSTPSSGKATGASPLTLASLNYWGSAPPPVAKPPEPPRSPSLRSITGVQHPLQWQSHRSLPAHPRFAQLLGFSTPSSGKATGASPLTLASLNYWGSAPPPVAKPPEPPRSPSLRSDTSSRPLRSASPVVNRSLSA